MVHLTLSKMNLTSNIMNSIKSKQKFKRSKIRWPVKKVLLKKRKVLNKLKLSMMLSWRQLKPKETNSKKESMTTLINIQEQKTIMKINKICLITLNGSKIKLKDLRKKKKMTKNGRKKRKKERRRNRNKRKSMRRDKSKGRREMSKENRKKKSIKLDLSNKKKISSIETQTMKLLTFAIHWSTTVRVLNLLLSLNMKTQEKEQLDRSNSEKNGQNKSKEVLKWLFLRKLNKTKKFPRSNQLNPRKKKKKPNKKTLNMAFRSSINSRQLNFCLQTM